MAYHHHDAGIWDGSTTFRDARILLSNDARLYDEADLCNDTGGFYDYHRVIL